MLISLFFIPCCRAAADQPYVDPSKGKGELIEDKKDTDSWDQAVQPFQPIAQRIELNLADKQIEAIPAGLDLPRLFSLNLEDNRIAAIPVGLNLPRLINLYLANNQITAIPADLNLPELVNLYLQNNQIDEIDPQEFRLILQGLPNLMMLDLSGNAISQENVDALREVARATHPNLMIIAEDIGGVVLKPAKVK